MKLTNLLSCFALVCLLPVHAEDVYDNSANDLSTRFETGAFETGDEINLAGTFRTLETFSFEFYYTNSVGSLGSPSIELTLYENNGPDFNGYATPGDVLYSSGALDGLITSFTDRSTLLFTQTDFGSSVVLPDTFTWTVQFSGLAGDDVVGLDIYDPPALGSSSRDYWIDVGSGWELREATVDPENNPINFAAVVTAVPEPSTYAMFLLGGLGCLFWRLRRRA